MPENDTSDVVPAPTQAEILAFAKRVKDGAAPMGARSNDVRAVIIERLLKANTLESILEAAQIGLPAMDEYIGVPVKVLDFALVQSGFESTDAYAVVDIVRKDGEKSIAGWGGQSVVDTLVRLREAGLIPLEGWVKLTTKKTSAGYDVYNLTLSK